MLIRPSFVRCFTFLLPDGAMISAAVSLSSVSGTSEFGKGFTKALTMLL